MGVATAAVGTVGRIGGSSFGQGDSDLPTERGRRAAQGDGRRPWSERPGLV